MRFTKRLLALTAIASLAVFGNLARADMIPYGHSGFYNNTSYTFTATSSGNVMAYFVDGKGASFENEMGMLINGILSPAGYGLNNHSSTYGQSYNLGNVNAGDVLTFVLHNLAFGGENAYSDPTMNVAYDLGNNVGHNHIYSTAYTATSPVFDGVPTGTYVAFEDLRIPGADFNYVDEAFVITNVSTRIDTTIPEPASLALLGLGLAGLGLIRRRSV